MAADKTLVMNHKREKKKKKSKRRSKRVVNKAEKVFQWGKTETGEKTDVKEEGRNKCDEGSTGELRGIK